MAPNSDGKTEIAVDWNSISKILNRHQKEYGSFVKRMEGNWKPDDSNKRISDIFSKVSKKCTPITTSPDTIKLKKLEEKIKKLLNICDIQSESGNWDWNEYMRGMANGLILAVSIMEDIEPVYFDQQKKYKEEKYEDNKKESAYNEAMKYIG